MAAGVLGAVVAVIVPLIRLAQCALLLRFLTGQLAHADDAARTEVVILIAKQLTTSGTESAPARAAAKLPRN